MEFPVPSTDMLLDTIFTIIFVIITISSIVCAYTLSKGKLAKSYYVSATGGIIGLLNHSLSLSRITLPFQWFPVALDMFALLLIAVALAHMASTYYSEWK
ncbi:MAG: hypothetical protein ACTSXX_13630 [Candidatus Baldrarchaeia archaeon]